MVIASYCERWSYWREMRTSDVHTPSKGKRSVSAWRNLKMAGAGGSFGGFSRRPGLQPPRGGSGPSMSVDACTRKAGDSVVGERQRGSTTPRRDRGERWQRSSGKGKRNSNLVQPNSTAIPIQPVPSSATFVVCYRGGRFWRRGQRGCAEAVGAQATYGARGGGDAERARLVHWALVWD